MYRHILIIPKMEGYFSYSSTSGEGEGANTKIIRAKLGDSGLEEVETLYKATPNSRRGVHYGSRLEFGTDGTLYLPLEIVGIEM